MMSRTFNLFLYFDHFFLTQNFAVLIPNYVLIFIKSYSKSLFPHDFKFKIPDSEAMIIKLYYLHIVNTWSEIITLCLNRER